ncbi:hypothetical protein ACS0TY_025369 [Phlomoides rotata]
MDNKMIPLAIFLASYLLQINVIDAVIGINWGRENAQRLLPSNVVDLMLQNGIRAARIFTTEDELLEAFAGSQINLTINIPSYNTIKSLQEAIVWVQTKKEHFIVSNVRQIYLSDFALSFSFNKTIINDAINGLRNLQEAINLEGFGERIKVTIPNHKGILKMNNTSLRPSEAEFLDIIKPEMTTFIQILEQNKAPFVVSITTIGDIQEWGVDYNFAFTDNKSSLVIRDVNGAVYTNAFEVMYDSYVWALKKLNASPDLRVIVGQVGWPTDGFPGANATMAERYFKSLLPFVSSNKGTPMCPGKPIDIYIQALTDENRIMYYGNGSFMRHWGIYMSNGKPKYNIDLSGRGGDNYLVESKGIQRMPQRWCVYNEDRSNIKKLINQMDKACALADCTALTPGGSCSHLDFLRNVTYVFNMYFQVMFQNETECDFEGLGRVSTVNPSTPECIFPVEVVRPEPKTSSAGKVFFVRPNSAIFVILLSILGTLFWN